MKILQTNQPGFKKQYTSLQGGVLETARIEATVRQIIEAVRRRGDRALLTYSRRFDHYVPRPIEVPASAVKKAYRAVGTQTLTSLKLAARRIERFHRLQAKRLPGSWSFREGTTSLGERIGPINRVGIYVPGGTAAYPSTVLMNAIPARIAGVREIVMVSPWSGGTVHPATLVAADLAGVTRIFRIGGAQAIAALAYGTKSVPAVDKIVGPGNAYVAAAKRLVFGQVGLDMIAGPTEVVIVADDTAGAGVVASDLLSQAEHDPMALAVLLTPSEKLAKAVSERIRSQATSLGRHKILEAAIGRRGRIMVTRNLQEAFELASDLAPEHLSLQVRNPRTAVKQVQNAGAIFIGPFSPVALGDYLAGPNHVLPTSGTARFSSPLGVSDFLKRSSVIEIGKKHFEELAPTVIRLAEVEGLTAHAASVRARLREKKP